MIRNAHSFTEHTTQYGLESSRRVPLPSVHSDAVSDCGLEDSFPTFSNFENLRTARIKNASTIVSDHNQPQNHEVFFSHALDRTNERLDYAKSKNNQQLINRLERRVTNLNKISDIIRSNNYHFIGAIGWGEDCLFKTYCGDGSSEIDSIYFKDQSGHIQFIQLDSCLEAQQLKWFRNSRSNSCLNEHGRVFSVQNNEWSDSSKIECNYKGQPVNLSLLSSGFSVDPTIGPSDVLLSSGSCTRVNHRSVPTQQFPEPTSSGLATFIHTYNRLMKTAPLSGPKGYDCLDKLKEKLFPVEDRFSNHKKDVERMFLTPQVVRANGISCRMPGDGTAVQIGMDFTQSGWDTIDQWVDFSRSKKSIAFEEPDKSLKYFLQKDLLPIHQVSSQETAEIMLNAVLFNAASDYSIATYDKSIYIEPQLAEQLLCSLHKKRDDFPPHMNGYFYQWIKEVVEGDKAQIDIAKKLLKQLHGFTAFADHSGICCPSCNEGKCELKLKTVSNIRLKRLQTSQDLSLRPLSLAGMLKQPQANEVVANLRIIFTSIQTKIEGLDLSGLKAYEEQLGVYGVNHAFKTAMMMKYIMAILDTIWVYNQSDPTSLADVDSSLSGRLGPEIQALEQVLFTLTTALVHNSHIPDGVSEENWSTPAIVASNYKARFAIAETVSGALELLKGGAHVKVGTVVGPIEEQKGQEEDGSFSLKGLSDLEKKAQETVYSRAKLNRAIEDEETYLKKFRRLNADPKVEPMDVRVPLGDRLGHLLRPVALNMVAGKLGVGKSQFLRSSFDSEAQTEIQGKRIYKLDNIEKATSDFDSKHSEPKKQVLLTITESKLTDLREQFPNLTDAKLSTEDDPDDAAKLVGCACCSGRGLTQAAIEAVDRGAKGLESEAIVLDSIGYADFKGMATISHESIMGRVFFNHAVTLVNLNNPEWKKVFDLKQTFDALKSKPNTQKSRGLFRPFGSKKSENTKCDSFLEYADEKFEGTFTNVLVQQLVHATHVFINNHGHGDGHNGITAAQLRQILAAIGQESVVEESFDARNPGDTPQLLSHFSSELSQFGTGSLPQTQIQPGSIPQEVDIFHSELDQSYTQVDLDTSALTDENMAAFLKEIIKGGHVDRAKGHYQDRDQRWVEYQITDGANFYDKHVVV